MNLPGFTGEASLYRTTAYRNVAMIWSEDSDSYLGPAQLIPPIPSAGLGCSYERVPTSVCATGCQATCMRPGGEITECVALSNCPPLPTICSPNCLLTIPQQVVTQLLNGQPINPAAIQFTRTCQQGNNPPFTIVCPRCSQETRISLPPISDRCITVCATALDPASISVSVREC
jgi:hypothetical protein